MTTEEKIKFLENDFPEFLLTLNADTKGVWGVMNAQQMVEHYVDSLREANGKSIKQIITPAEVLPKYIDFIRSEKPFKENTKNPLMPEAAPPVKHSSMQNAVEELKHEWNDFKNAFKDNQERKITNPIFGHLNYEEWVQLLYKHARHHAKQFGYKEN